MLNMDTYMLCFAVDGLQDGGVVAMRPGKNPHDQC